MRRAKGPVFRLFFAAILINPLPFWSGLAYAGPDDKPAPVKEEYDERALLRDFERAPEGNAGTFGKSRAVVNLVYAGPEPSPLRIGVITKYIDSKLADTVKAGGGGAIDAKALRDLLEKPENQAAMALVLDATGNKATRDKLMAWYADLKTKGEVQDFNSFIKLLAEQSRGKAPEKTLVHRILTEAEPPRGPKNETKKEGEGEERGPAAERRKKAAEQTDKLRTYWKAEEIYGKEGDPNFFTVGGRSLTFNIVTVKHEDGAMVQKLAVYDVTNTSDIHGWTFALDDPRLKGNFTFSLDDRENSTNPAKYTISLVPSGNDFKIAFAGGKGEDPAVPSINELFRHRAQKVRNNGYVVKVGDKEYYLGAEGHSGIGQNTYWEKSVLDKLADGEFDPKNFIPALASTAVKREGGRDIPVTSSSIGQVGEKWYDQRWNAEKGVMEVVEGLPPAAGPVAGPALPRVPGQLDGWPDMADKGFVPDQALNALLSPDAGGKVRFYFSKKDSSEVLMMVGKDPEALLPLKFGRIKIIAGETGKGRVLSQVAEKDGGGVMIRYLDLSKEIKLKAPDPEGKRHFDFSKAEAGSLDLETHKFNDLRHRETVEHALKTVGYSPATIGKIVSRMGSRVAGKSGFMVNGDNKLVTLLVDNTPYEIWPQDAAREGSDLPGVPPEGSHGIVMDRGKFAPKAVDDRNALGLDKIDVGGKQVKAEAVSLGGAALSSENKAAYQPDRAKLYLATSEDGKKKAWVLAATMRATKGKGDDALPKRFDAALFTSPGSGPYYDFPGADKIVVRGLDIDAEKLPDMANFYIRVIKKGDKGVVAVFNGESGKASSLVGVVGFWGVKLQEAADMASDKSS